MPIPRDWLYPNLHSETYRRQSAQQYGLFLAHSVLSLGVGVGITLDQGRLVLVLCCMYCIVARVSVVQLCKYKGMHVSVCMYLYIYIHTNIHNLCVCVFLRQIDALEGGRDAMIALGFEKETEPEGPNGEGGRNILVMNQISVDDVRACLAFLDKALR